MRPKFVAILKDITHLIYYKSLKVKYQKFEYFIRHNLILSQKEFDSLESLSKELPIYDCYISGSDQIWNPNPCDFSMAYLLPFIPEESKRISYASSMGPSGVFTRPLPQGYVESLARYKYISVRENKSALLVQDILPSFKIKTNSSKSVEVKIVCDPVFLLSKQEWIERLIGQVPILKKKYIFFYTLFADAEAISMVKELSKRTGLPIVVANFTNAHDFVNPFEKHYNSGPLDFLNFIYYAEMVCTSSFHGTAFTVLLNKQLVSIRGMGDNRISSLLKYMGMQDRSVANLEKMRSFDLNVMTDYELVNKKIKNYSSEGKSFLKNSLNGTDL